MTTSTNNIIFHSSKAHSWTIHQLLNFDGEEKKRKLIEKKWIKIEKKKQTWK